MYERAVRCNLRPTSCEPHPAVTHIAHFLVLSVRVGSSDPNVTVSSSRHIITLLQDDLLNGALTVLETLNYTAELKLPPSTAPETRAKRVEEVARQVGGEEA